MNVEDIGMQNLTNLIGHHTTHKNIYVLTCLGDMFETETGMEATWYGEVRLI